MIGKIVKGVAGFYDVHVMDHGIYECKAKGIFRKEKIKPLVGDNVEIDVLDEVEKTGNIINILERKNDLVRPLVANIDQVFVLFAITKPKLHFQLLDRLLVMMEQKEIPIIIGFNKSDIVTKEECDEIKAVYENSGYSVLFLSGLLGTNMEALKELLIGKTTVIAGPSGVGKSTIINLLYPHAEMETGEISRKIERGKHTTRHSELFTLAENSYIMDTPGFSTLYKNEFEKEELKQYFPEFSPYENQCKYIGCNHMQEPQCSVKQAVSENMIHESRYKSYAAMYKELEERKRY